ncbi:MAG: hypothetical protein J6K42_07685 [Clostridia bacterium]|nr:hypothetical protein [Clostridia bacterium]
MNNNLTYEVVKKEVQKKIINYLYQNNEITISEYETLISKCDEKINKIKDQIDKEKNNYIHPVKVDIRI